MPMILDSPSSPPSADLDSRRERRQVHHEADAVVVGAGILGCAIATTLARQGRSVVLLEKSLKEPDRIVGELLQPGGVAALEKLGLRDCLEGIDAIKVYGYEVIYYGEGVVVDYPEDSTSESKPEGRSFHHGRFIQRLREKAMKEPNITVVETTATDLIKNGYSGQVLGVKCKTQSQKDFYFGNLTIVSDGYASTFRKDQRTAPIPSAASTPSAAPHPHSPTSKSKFYGLELLDCPLPTPQHGHVVLGDGAPVLLYQIGTHETRALIDVPANTPSASVANGGVKGHLRKQVLPSLPPSIQASFDAALRRVEKPGEASMEESDKAKAVLRSMPNSFLPSTTNTTPGLVLLGDALNMRHPLTGGGMTVAFNDVVLLSELLQPDAVGLSLTDTRAVLKAMKNFHWERKRLAGVVNILAQALYSLFAADELSLRALQLGCFRYFQLGGACISGPTGLLAGLTRRPFVLVYHFFAVALYAIWLQLIGRISKGSSSGRCDSSNDSRLNGTGGKLATSIGDRGIKEKYKQESPIRSIINLPLRLLFGVKVLWTACVVIFPYILAEMRP